PVADTPVRIVLSSAATLSPENRLVKSVSEAPVWVATSVPPESPAAQQLRTLGCEVICLPPADRTSSVHALLDELGRRRLTNILVEGGSALLGSFRDADAIDEVHVFLAPRLIGGTTALTPMAGQGVEQVNDALPLAEWQSEP